MVYENIYPDIDMHVYSGRAGQKIAFVIRPGGDPQNLQLLLEGQNQLTLDFMGNLRILLQTRWIVLRQAVAYQVDGNSNVELLNWTADYVPNNNTGVVGFTFDAYDNTKPLVLLVGMYPADGPPYTPGVCYSTFFGGQGTTITANTFDEAGNHYVTGRTSSNFTSFPGQTGYNIFSDSPNLFACRMNDQDHIMWKDFFGGSDHDELATGIAIREGLDPKVFVGGLTQCDDFHCVDAVPGSDYFDNTGGTTNGFIVRLDHDDGYMEHSTYFGDYLEEIRDITVDPSGRLIVVGWTNGQLPAEQVTPPPGAEQWGFGGMGDGFIALFNLNEQVLWSTPFGGAGEEIAYTVRASNDKIVVAGLSYSPTFPQYHGGGGDWNVSSNSGGGDIMLLEFNLNGDQQWGTLFGGSQADYPGFHGLDIDPVTGDIYIVGTTQSVDLPVYHPTDWYDATPLTAQFHGFIAEFTASRDRRWVTPVSNMGYRALDVVRVSDDREVFMGGRTSNAIPCMPLSNVYSESSLLGSSDGVVMRFSPSHDYLWGTHFGGNDLESLNTLALNGNGRLYVCGSTTSAYQGEGNFFPLTDELIPYSWFDDFYPGAQGGFVAAFCFWSVVGTPTDPTPSELELLAWPVASDQWMVAGAEAGTQQLWIVDAAGRTVKREQVIVTPDVPLSMEAGDLVPGNYFLRIGDRTAKLVLARP